MISLSGKTCIVGPPEGGEFDTTHSLMFLSDMSRHAETAPLKKDHDEAPIRVDRLFLNRRSREVPCLPPEERKIMITSVLNGLKTLTPKPLRPMQHTQL